MSTTAAAEQINTHWAGLELPKLKARFEAAYSAARRLENVPYRLFDFRRDQFLRRCAGQPSGEQHRALSEGLEFFEHMKDPKNWPLTRSAEDQQHAAQVAAAAAAQLQAQGFGFNAHAFVAGLRARGISIATSAKGEIVVSPATSLNAIDRETLTNAERRRAIVTVLHDTEIF